MKVIKRDGRITEFNKDKIEAAILNAMKYGSGIVKEHIAKSIAESIDKTARVNEETPLTVYKIEDMVYYMLVQTSELETAKAYEGYRAIQSFKRETNTTDDSILSLIEDKNVEVAKENSNKNATIAATQRDLIAGEVSKDLTRRKLLPARIVQAHDDGVLHFHDMDYFAQKIFNCCLVNIKDMLDNGTVINEKMVESPKSFQVACTVMTQIIAQVASSQYGGQSINIKHLGKYLRKTYDKYYAKYLEHNLSKGLDRKQAEALAEEFAKLRRQEDLEAGIQTIQYQINTLFSTNGQSPFVTLFLEIEEGHEHEQEIADIVEEILKQRIIGIKNEKGVYITPAFPKLVYVLDEHNSLKGGKYDYITKTAAQCSAKRMYPDYVSAKKMKEQYEGNVFSCMGCRSWLSPWKDENGDYKFEGRFNMGVVSLNLPQIGIIAKNEEEFWKLLDERLELCKQALLLRYEALKGTKSDVSPVHWQYGAIARLEKGQTIDHLLENGYATISLGYIGLYELTKLVKGVSHTTKEGSEFAKKVLSRLREATDTWKKETGLGFGLYGTPSESLCYRFARIDKSKFGVIKDITDKEYYTNSYHVDVREEIDAFSKLKFESQFQSISSGGCISYIEIPNLLKNTDAIEQVIKYMYENIQYSEFNTKTDHCHKCGFEGEIIINKDVKWECPQCGNDDEEAMTVVRRTCGYLGEKGFNHGKMREIQSRVMHL